MNMKRLFNISVTLVFIGSVMAIDQGWPAILLALASGAYLDILARVRGWV